MPVVATAVKAFTHEIYRLALPERGQIRTCRSAALKEDEASNGPRVGQRGAERMRRMHALLRREDLAQGSDLGLVWKAGCVGKPVAGVLNALAMAAVGGRGRCAVFPRPRVGAARGERWHRPDVRSVLLQVLASRVGEAGGAAIPQGSFRNTGPGEAGEAGERRPPDSVQSGVSLAAFDL